MDMDRLTTELIRDEALRLRMYKCSEGKHTIGVGHNLDAKGISKRAAQVIFEDDIADVTADLDRFLPWWKTLSDARQRVLVNMAFNLGIAGLMGFKNTLEMIRTGRYEDAAVAMLQSKWAGQVGDRAKRLSDMMRKG